jgi:predicted PurR-regulated permease PerM
LALIPAGLFALLQGPTQVLYVVVLYGAIQAVEGYVLTPLIDRTTVKLPPALTLTAMVVAALLFGWLGLLLEAPAAAALMVLVQMVYVEDILGERDAR